MAKEKRDDFEDHDLFQICNLREGAIHKRNGYQTKTLRLAKYILNRYKLTPKISVWPSHEYIYIYQDPKENKEAATLFQDFQHDNRFNFKAPATFRDYFSIKVQQGPKKILNVQLEIDAKVYEKETDYIFTAKTKHFHRGGHQKDGIEIPETIEWKDGICDCHSKSGIVKIDSVQLSVCIVPLLGCSWTLDLGAWSRQQLLALVADSSDVFSACIDFFSQ